MLHNILVNIYDKFYLFLFCQTFPVFLCCRECCCIPVILHLSFLILSCSLSFPFYSLHFLFHLLLLLGCTLFPRVVIFSQLDVEIIILGPRVFKLLKMCYKEFLRTLLLVLHPLNNIDDKFSPSQGVGTQDQAGQDWRRLKHMTEHNVYNERN